MPIPEWHLSPPMSFQSLPRRRTAQLSSTPKPILGPAPPAVFSLVLRRLAEPPGVACNEFCWEKATQIFLLPATLLRRLYLTGGNSKNGRLPRISCHR